ncbi:MAG: nucleoside/nucleotide kinase family protein [Gammaproteobacteria bacterium]|nr:nucleoside/nucleotide kinase family protein [Gammaproteobacteria bacterium]
MNHQRYDKLEQLANRIIKDAANKSRYLFAIAGAPGSGKSTLVQSLQLLLQTKHQLSCQIVAMDGFHLDNETLQQQGLLAVKGSPQTFNLTALEQLLAKVKLNQATVLAPIFNRDIDAVVNDAIAISNDTKIILIEGNYLLLKQLGWQRLAQYFDASVLLDVPIEVLRQRLITRWLDQGFDLKGATTKADSNDIPNAQLVIDHSDTRNIISNQ